jgi:YceI-like domain
MVWRNVSMKSFFKLIPYMVTLVACGKSPANQKDSAATATAPVTVSSATAGEKEKNQLQITAGEATFLIDAPLEKIKGVSSDVQGLLTVVPTDLRKTHGSVKVALSTLRTTTFEDKGKNESQTEHARNWMEVGAESPSDRKALFAYATFVFNAVDTPVQKLEEVPEQQGQRTLAIKAEGLFTLHGVEKRKTLALQVTFRGPAEEPQQLEGKSTEPFLLSLQEHDIKPRDTVGKFLNGALEKVGKKIDDKVQVSLTFTAH